MIDRPALASPVLEAGWLFLQMALDYPELVQTLALFEPPLASVPSAADFFEKVGPFMEAYSEGDREDAMAGFLSVACSMPWETCRAVLEESVPGSVALAMNDAGNFFESILPALSSWEFGREQAARIDQPVLSVIGTETEALFAESHDLLHVWFPQLEDCVIGGVAHLLHLQRPAPVVEGLGAFLAAHSSGATRQPVRASVR